MSKMWIKIEVDSRELELWVEHGEEIYAKYFNEHCIDFDDEKAWEEWRERQYEAK